MIRILQLGGDPSFRQAMETYFRSVEDVCYRGIENGNILQRALNEDKPEVVLLDMDLQPQGGMTALERIRARFSSQEMKVIVLATQSTSEDELAQSVRSGADYFMERPVDFAILETRIRQLVTELHKAQPSGELTRRQVQEICTRYFDLMGLPPHYKGYRYLMEGVWLAALHRAWLSSVTQKLYPAIGESFGVNGAQVERSMRYALDVTWEKGNLDQLYHFFPYIRENKGKPTNSAFIAKMVDLVRLEARGAG